MKFLSILFLLLSCSQKSQKSQETYSDSSVLAILYVQQSAEYRALAYQAYNLAQLKLEKELLKRDAIPKAIVIDIDETILDNSRFNSQLVLDRQEYSSERWAKWSDQAIADTVPGALTFLKYADQNGITIFYVSNRKIRELNATKKNLDFYGFPQLRDSQLLLKDSTSSKMERRNHILNSYKILLLVGDNLNDFSDVFEKKSNAERSLEADRMKMEFGDRFIILPNPIYGEWESALYNYDFKLSPQEKRAIRQQLLKR